MRKLLVLAIVPLVTACGTAQATTSSPTAAPLLPHEERWGIYRLDIHSLEVEPIFSSPTQLYVRSSACSRTEHVLNRRTSASSIELVVA